MRTSSPVIRSLQFSNYLIFWMINELKDFFYCWVTNRCYQLNSKYMLIMWNLTNHIFVTFYSFS